MKNLSIKQAYMFQHSGQHIKPRPMCCSESEGVTPLSIKLSAINGGVSTSKEFLTRQAYMNEDWFKMLKEQCDVKTARVVAQELGHSKSTLSLVLNGRYVGKTDRVRDRVLAYYEIVSCPHLDKVLQAHECVALAISPAPNHNPIKMQQWRACQVCPKRPKGGAK